MKRVRAGVVVIRDDKVLLMYRRKAGQEYYVIPGGSVEKGESIEDAAIREAKEETGYDVRIDRELFTEENDYGEHHYYLVHPVEGEPFLGGEEALLHNEDNFYRLDWVHLEQLSEANLIMPSTKDLLLRSLDLAPLL